MTFVSILNYLMYQHMKERSIPKQMVMFNKSTYVFMLCVCMYTYK